MATDIFVSDYHADNPDYYEMFNVLLSAENSVNAEYIRGTRKRGINISFTKKVRDQRLYKK
jgi:hypothetical protein